MKILFLTIKKNMTKILEIFRSIESAKVIAPKIDYIDYIQLDLSVSNLELHNHKLENASDYEIFIQKYLDKNKGKIAFGGYIETRNLYKRSTVFKNEITAERNIHIGLDLWINEAASVHAALDGKIHSFQNNIALGDYGPTIILEHEIDGFVFHTLYGHLSEASLTDKKLAKQLQKAHKLVN